MADEVPVPHPSDWRVTNLSKITLKIGSGATPLGGKEAYLSERCRFALVRSQNVCDRRFEIAGLAFISDEQARHLKGVILNEGDLLLNITGDGVTFSRACAVPADVLPAVVNQHVAIIRVNPALADAGFVLAYLTHPSVKDYIEGFNAGGSRRAITKAHIESFQLALPPLHEQHAIAEVLGMLDEKIDLGRRLSETLEAIARELFNSWFVDFDPVRYNAEGRESCLPNEVAELFPDSFQESDLGEIPRGWSIGKVGDIASLSREGLKPGDFPDEVFAHFSIPAFDSERVPRIEKGGTVKSQKFIVLQSSVLFSKLNPRIPRVWLPEVSSSMRAICSTEFLVVLPRTGIPREVLYCLFSSRAFSGVFGSLVTGTSGSHQRVKPESLLAMGTVLPGPPVIRRFVHEVQPLLIRANRARDESTTVASLRDALLPKLISGELRLRDAERIVGRNA